VINKSLRQDKVISLKNKDKYKSVWIRNHFTHHASHAHQSKCMAQ